MSDKEVLLVLRAALRHMRYFKAWDYSGSMDRTIRRIEKVLATRGL